MSNLSEYQAGTDPLDGNNLLRIAGFNNYALNFESVTGLLYRVEMTDDLTNSVWPVLSNNIPVTNISGASGSQQFWKLTVPAGQTQVVFNISGGTGDADLYVRRGSRPTTATFDYSDMLLGAFTASVTVRHLAPAQRAADLAVLRKARAGRYPLIPSEAALKSAGDATIAGDAEAVRALDANSRYLKAAASHPVCNLWGI